MILFKETRHGFLKNMKMNFCTKKTTTLSLKSTRISIVRTKDVIVIIHEPSVQ